MKPDHRATRKLLSDLEAKYCVHVLVTMLPVSATEENNSVNLYWFVVNHFFSEKKRIYVKFVKIFVFVDIDGFGKHILLVLKNILRLSNYNIRMKLLIPSPSGTTSK